MRKCSYCGRENPDEAASCTECLTQLAAPAAADENKVPPTLAEVQAGKNLRITGAVLLLGGLVVTLFSYLEAVRSPYGGHYVIAIGAICYGAMRFFQGHAMATGRIEANERGQQLLYLAARLEDVNRQKAVALYEEVLKKYPGTAASEEAQRNIRALTAGHSSEAPGTARPAR
jgi:hypothetical protein